MKHAAFAAMVQFAMPVSFPRAHAVTCAEGVFRAGCAGPNGAAVVRKPALVTCSWTDGRRVFG